jgi:two-component system, chemotaxis family, protein-glutamate methylesterase/glutaminase
MARRDIVVMGASAGGVEAFQEVVSAFPQDLPAAVFITLHTGPTSPGLLADVLSKSSRLPIVQGENGIRHGRIYFARPNLHLIVRRGHIEHRFLPRENMTRPAIDPMFRSAAQSYGRRVIGVLMTGNLDDGSAGLGIIKDEGGLAIVQDPRDARYPDMPFSATQYVSVDHLVPLAEIGPLIIELVNKEIEEGSFVAENKSLEGKEVLSCPGCGGVLRQYYDNKIEWYQCQVGHRHTIESMLMEQDNAIEKQLWGAPWLWTVSIVSSLP